MKKLKSLEVAIFDLVKLGLNKKHLLTNKEMSEKVKCSESSVSRILRKLEFENKIKRVGNRAIKIIGE